MLMFFLWYSHPHQHIPIRIPISSCLYVCGSNPWYPKSQLVNGWFLSQSYGKFISFDPSPYSHRKPPSKSLGQMAPRRYFPGCDPHRTCVPWSGPSQLGNFGNWMEESCSLESYHGKIHRKPWCFTLNMGAAVCFAIIQCWENGENHGEKKNLLRKTCWFSVELQQCFFQVLAAICS